VQGTLLLVKLELMVRKREESACERASERAEEELDREVEKGQKRL
jgi:hypothetical protein